jgi:hypothetical protein
MNYYFPEQLLTFREDDKALAHLNDNETSSRTRGGGDNQEYLTYQDPMGTSMMQENTM